MLFGQEHVERYRETDGREGHEWQGTQTLLLTTTGRKSGEERTTPLIYAPYGDSGDAFTIVASKGGADEPPAWYLNLSEKPEVEVQVLADRFHARARTASAEEKPAIWKTMVAEWPAYDDYQQQTDREIPVVILERNEAEAARMPFTLRNLKEDLDDVGSNFDGPPDLEFRLATDALQLAESGLSLQRIPPGYRFPYGHTHETQEEVYVVVRGSGRMKLDDEIVGLREWDAVRVPPGTWRGYEAGPEGLELLVIGAPSLGDGRREDVEGTRDWWTG